jgi:ATP-dependent DNA helicase RecG
MNNPHYLLELIENRESDQVEFKTSISSDSIHDIVAFLNSSGGMIFYGVNNEGKVVGVKASDPRQKISDLLQAVHPAPQTKIHLLKSNKNKIFCLQLFSDGRLYSHKQKVWIRVGANNRPLDLHEMFSYAGESALFSFDQQLSHIPVDDAKISLIKDFFNSRKKHRNLKIPDDDCFRVLEKMGYARDGRLTYGGVLLFGKSVNQQLVNNRVHVVIFKDRVDRIVLDNKEFQGNLLGLIDSVLDFLHISIPIWSNIKGRERVDIPQMPIEMLREIVTNALLHRNYVDTNEVKIFIAPGEMEIINPGSFLFGVSPEKPQHKTRNNMLAQYLFEIGRIEKYGSGIPLIFRLAKINQLSVHYFLEAFSTRIIIRKKDGDRITERILKILKGKSLTAAEISQMTGLSRSTIQRRLRKLLKTDMIISEGRGKATRYSRV